MTTIPNFADISRNTDDAAAATNKAAAAEAGEVWTIPELSLIHI